MCNPVYTARKVEKAACSLDLSDLHWRHLIMMDITFPCNPIYVVKLPLSKIGIASSCIINVEQLVFVAYARVLHDRTFWALAEQV